MEELIEEIDWAGNVVAVRAKAELKKRMFPHRVSLVIPRADEEKLLLCRRAKDKHPFPDTWCCAVGGKVLAGESSEDAARREMIEEIGMEVPLVKVTSFKYDETDYRGMFTIFTTDTPIPKEKFKLDEGEIQYLKAFSIPDLRLMMKKNPDEFAPTFRAALEAFVQAVQ